MVCCQLGKEQSMEDKSTDFMHFPIYKSNICLQKKIKKMIIKQN